MTMERNALRRELRERFPRDHGQLLPALHYIQDEFGHLPGWAMEVVGWHLAIPASEVYGAATSYTELRTERPGECVVRVCTALSCAVAGARDILDALSAHLGIPSGGTSADGRFSLEEIQCGFLCGMAPTVEVSGKWHGRLNENSAVELVEG